MSVVGATSRLYPTHLPIAGAARAALAAGASVGAFLWPQRADLVAAVGELTGEAAFQAMHKRMQRDATGRLLLHEKPVITVRRTPPYDSFMDACERAPDGSFGQAYADFMGRRRFKASERPPVRFVNDPEVAYVATRYRQVHDLWHVLFDCHTSLVGETALKALEFAQTGLPMTAMSVAAGQARLRPEQQVLLTTQLLPWAARAGVQCADLMCIYYERHLDDDLQALRQQWRILTAPHFVEAAPQQQTK